MTPSPRCTICHVAPAGVVEVSLHGEVTCTVHEVRGRCVFCSRPHSSDAPPGWRSFSRRLRCPTCLVGAVETQAEVRARLPAVRVHMAAIGVELAPRVRVRVIDPKEVDHLVGEDEGNLLVGLTDQWISAGQPVRVAGIRILKGLPPIHFGRAVAHEIGHAWLAQQGAVELPPAIEEGVCELFAYAWLKRQGPPIAARLREALRTNPDRTYGGGFRAVHAATRTTDVGAVLAAVLRTGRLP